MVQEKETSRQPIVHIVADHRLTYGIQLTGRLLLCKDEVSKLLNATPVVAARSRLSALLAVVKRWGTNRIRSRHRVRHRCSMSLRHHHSMSSANYTGAATLTPVRSVPVVDQRQGRRPIAQGHLPRRGRWPSAAPHRKEDHENGPLTLLSDQRRADVSFPAGRLDPFRYRGWADAR